MFILFSTTMIGLMLAERTFSMSADEFAISKCTQSFFITLLVLLFLLVALILHSSPILHWLFIGIILISLKFFPYILRFFLLRRLARSLIPFLDIVILGMQTGKSFRIALFAATELQEGWLKFQFNEIYNSIDSSVMNYSVKSLLIKDFQAELVQIDRSQNRVIDQVRALRRHLKIQENFRRRSMQVTQQIKMQAIIVTLLYLLLLSFVINQFGFTQNKNVILISGLIFTFGLIWIFKVGRRIKWKV